MNISSLRLGTFAVALLAAAGHAWADGAQPSNTKGDGKPFAVAANTNPQTNSSTGDGKPATVVGSTDGDGTEEVYVTAERRSTPLSKTPVAVTAVEIQDVQTQNLEILRDLQGQVPGLATPGGIPNMQSIFIRGIGTTDPGTYPAVGVYIDDVYLPRIFGDAIFDLPDLNSIEVLRGPQATLYGQNTSAGVVKYTTRDPDDQFVLHSDASYGSFNLIQAHDYVAGAIIPGELDGSLAIAHRQQDGFIFDTAINRDVNRIYTEQARGKLHWTPTGQLDVVLSVDGGLDNSDNPTFIPVTGVSPIVPLYGRRTNAADPVTSNGNLKLKRTAGGSSLRVTYQDGGHWTFKSISAGRFLNDNPSPWDYDSTTAPINDFTQTIHENFFSQELQAIGTYDDLTVTTGVTAFHENFRFARFSGVIASGLPAYSEVQSNISDTSGAFYLQGEYHITPKLGVTAGFRFNDESQNYRNTGYTDDSAGDRLVTLYTLSGLTHNWTEFTPKFSLDYQWTDTLMTYASYTQGERTGGYNRSASTASIAAVPTNPEKVTTYELGLKSRDLDGRLNSSATLFYNNFNNYIASVTNPTVNNVLVTGLVTVNAGQAHSEGLELEEEYRPIDNLSLKLTGTLLNSRFDNFANPTGAAGTNYTGKRLPYASNGIAGGAATYTVPIDYGALQFEASSNYISSFYSDIGNTQPFRVGDQTYTNVGIIFRAETNWNVALRVQNLLDAQTMLLRNGYVAARNENEVTYAQPRQITFTVGFDL